MQTIVLVIFCIWFMVSGVVFYFEIKKSRAEFKKMKEERYRKIPHYEAKKEKIAKLIKELADAEFQIDLMNNIRGEFSIEHTNESIHHFVGNSKTLCEIDVKLGEFTPSYATDKEKLNFEKWKEKPLFGTKCKICDRRVDLRLKYM